MLAAPDDRRVVPAAPATGATAAFLGEHAWVVPRPHVEALRVMPGHVWLCGGISNDDEVWDLFDEIICLTVDVPTLRHRLATRTTNNFGKAPDELAAILSWHATYDDECARSGARLIDATRPVGEVVADIIGTRRGVSFGRRLGSGGR